MKRRRESRQMRKARQRAAAERERRAAEHAKVEAERLVGRQSGAS